MYRELNGLTMYLEKLSEEQTVAKKQLDQYIKGILSSKHSAEKQLLDMKRTMVEGTTNNSTTVSIMATIH